jgi:hypothetical protein
MRRCRLRFEAFTCGSTATAIILRFDRSRKQMMKQCELELSKPYETDRHVDSGRFFAGNHVDRPWPESIPRIGVYTSTRMRKLDPCG